LAFVAAVCFRSLESAATGFFLDVALGVVGVEAATLLLNN
jgi:hypothetical protein